MEFFYAMIKDISLKSTANHIKNIRIKKENSLINTHKNRSIAAILIENFYL
jgi:hypothetical protein